MIEIVDSIDKDKWDSFVLNHPKGNIFQTSYMFDIFKNTRNYYPIKLFALESGHICGLLIGLIVTDLNNAVGKYMSRGIIQGGPLAKDDSIEIINQLLSSYNRIAEKKAVFSEIRNLFDNKMDVLPSYKFEDHLNFLIDLNQDEKQLWSKLHKHRRKNISKSLKIGVQIRELTNRNDIPVFYKLLEDTYKNVNVPLADISLFQAAFDELYKLGFVKYFLCIYDNREIGCRAILNYKQIVYDWYAGSSREFAEISPDSYLVWHILLWGSKNGYHYFDFGGAGKPDEEYGPREFKRRFGGELVNYGRYSNNHSKYKMLVMKKGYSLYKGISKNIYPILGD